MHTTRRTLAALDAGLVGDLLATFRATCRLPAYLRNPLTPEQCRAIVRDRLDHRERDFLDLARRTIFAAPTSPYRSLLRLAGCEYGDLERMVRADGVEGALGALLRGDVYLTVDEFKGRQPVVRGSTTIACDPRRLRNPISVPHLWGSTSGSRGTSTRTPLDLACVRDWAVNMNLALDARGGAAWQRAVWGTPGIIPLLWYSAPGIPVARWFIKVDPGALGRRSRLRWAIRVVRWTSRLARVSVPAPEYAPVDDPRGILEWMRTTLGDGRPLHLWSTPSSVVRLSHAAEREGVDLNGAHFTITGEPVTEACLAAIRRVRGDALPDYGSVDSGGSVTCGCLSPEAADDVHVFSDLNAVIQADGPPFPRDALLISSLRPTAPFVLLNVSMGDRATMTDRRCGCPMERLGWRTHLHTIRSYEKLTAGGVTFEDTDVIRILEEVLPARFGGGPRDYQLVEEQAGDGEPRLRLLMHPAIGSADPAAVAGVFLDAIAAGAEPRRHMAAEWRAAGLLRVEREAPRASGSGKILHLIAAPSVREGGV
jgi:hypothetical protein